MLPASTCPLPLAAAQSQRGPGRVLPPLPCGCLSSKQHREAALAATITAAGPCKGCDGQWARLPVHAMHWGLNGSRGAMHIRGGQAVCWAPGPLPSASWPPACWLPICWPPACWPPATWPLQCWPLHCRRTHCRRPQCWLPTSQPVADLRAGRRARLPACACGMQRHALGGR
jgi:hypothetical protein